MKHDGGGSKDDTIHLLYQIVNFTSLFSDQMSTPDMCSVKTGSVSRLVTVESDTGCRTVKNC